MNLTKLFETQAELDAHIIEEKGLQGQDLLDKKILALQVELGELANEHRGFKFWSENQDPRTEYICKLCEGSGEISREVEEGCGEMGFDVYEVAVNCPVCEDIENDANPLLEEYVDVLHFILNIGNELGINDVEAYEINNQNSTVDAFKRMYISIVNLVINIDLNRSEGKVLEYNAMFNNFIRLGELLGFTWEQIEQAYYEKNEINHERQANGY